LAGELFLVHPILGVGPGNFGTNAAEYFAGQGHLGNIFNDPSMLYMWFLHNDYVQVLVEQGLVGIFVMGAILVGFNNRLRSLRTEGARRRWHDQTGGFIDLRYVSLGLEVAMIGYLANAVFYGHIYLIHWFWSLIMLAHVLVRVTRTGSVAIGRRGRAQVPTARTRPGAQPVAGRIS
jgi:O-antigen ligase